MDYEVIVTEDAEIDMERFINYFLFEKKSDQATSDLIDDFEDTITTLTHAAESFKVCENQHLMEPGYRRINFRSLYRVEEDKVYVGNIFHELQDFESR